MTVAELIILLESLPENFKDSVVYIDDKAIRDTFFDAEHGEMNLRSGK